MANASFNCAKALLLMHLHHFTAGMLIAIAAFSFPSPASAARLAHIQDQTGHSFTMAELRGEPLALTFVAAHCTDACPLVNAQFAIAQRTIIAQKLHVRLLTVTLDPEHDPPATMRNLAHVFDADPRYWLVASGDRPEVHAIMAAFGVVAERGKKGYADVHTTFVYLLDSRGRLRKTMLASSGLGSELVAELQQNWRELTT